MRIISLCTLVLSTFPVHAMSWRVMQAFAIGGKPAANAVMRAAQRPAVSRIAARSAITQIPRVAVARTQNIRTRLPVMQRPQTLQPRVARTLIPSQPASKNHHQHKSNPQFSRYRLCLGGLGFAGALYLGSQIAKTEEKDVSKQEAERYVPPFEEQRKKYYEVLKAKPWGKVAEKYIKQLEDEKRTLMEEFFKLTGITAKEWEEERIENQTVYCYVEQEKIEKIQSLTPVAYNIEKQFKKFLENLGMQHKIKFIVTQKNSFTMTSYQNYVGISFAWNLWHVDDEMKFGMLHEIQHLLHNDHFSVLGFRTVCRKKNNHNAEKVFEKKYRWFIEKRADLLAGLYDSSYCKAIADIIRPEDEDHPSAAETTKYMTQLYQEMLEEIEQNKQN